MVFGKKAFVLIVCIALALDCAVSISFIFLRLNKLTELLIAILHLLCSASQLPDQVDPESHTEGRKIWRCDNRGECDRQTGGQSAQRYRQCAGSIGYGLLGHNGAVHGRSRQGRLQQAVRRYRIPYYGLPYLNLDIVI